MGCILLLTHGTHMNGWTDARAHDGAQAGASAKRSLQTTQANGATRAESQRPTKQEGREDEGRLVAGAARPAGPPAPTRVLKRQRIEYVPVSRPGHVNPGVWDPVQIEDTVASALSRRSQRSVADLGHVDARVLKMCIRSRLAAEVSYALNAIALISTAPEGAKYSLLSHRELLEELLDLFRAVVRGQSEDSDVDSEAEHDDDTSARAGEKRPANAVENFSKSMQAPMLSKSTSKLGASIGSSIPKKRSYRQACESMLDDEFGLETHDKEHYRPHSSYFAGLPRTTLAMTCLGILRNLSYDPGSHTMLARDARVIESSLLLLEHEHQRPNTIPHAENEVQLGPTQLLQCQKDILQMIGNFGPAIQLDHHPAWATRAILELVDEFLEWNRPDVVPFPPERGGPSYGVGAGLDAALLVLSRVALTDANRDAISKHPLAASIIREKFPLLVQHLPVVDLDFHLLTQESALLRTELVAMSLFNLIYMAGSETRKRLRDTSPITRTLAKVIRKLYAVHFPNQSNQHPNGNQYAILCLRCIEVLRVLSEDEVGGHQNTGTGSQEGIAWFGGSSDTDGVSGHDLQARPSLLFCRPDFVELLATPVGDKVLFSSLADCT